MTTYDDERPMYVAAIVDMDDVQPYYAVGPYETEDVAQEEGDGVASFLNDETLPGHIRPHTWEAFVLPVQTPNEIILRFQK